MFIKESHPEVIHVLLPCEDLGGQQATEGLDRRNQTKTSSSSFNFIHASYLYQSSSSRIIKKLGFSKGETRYKTFSFLSNSFRPVELRFQLRLPGDGRWALSPRPHTAHRAGGPAFVLLAAATCSWLGGLAIALDPLQIYVSEVGKAQKSGDYAIWRTRLPRW